MYRERHGCDEAAACAALGIFVANSPNAPPPAPYWQEECDQLLREGNLIGAIKLHREHTHAGLVDSKNAMEHRREQLRALAAPAPVAKGGVDPEVLRLVRAGHKIEAIKRVRELTGLGLKEAKDYVESL